MTPATAFLKAKAIAFSEHEYVYVEHGGTEVPARALQVDEHCIVKTLVMEDEARKPLIVLMHGDRQVSKNLARQAGRKSIEQCKPEAAQRHTGYQIGGTSPFATRKSMPVFAERSLFELPEIYINGGRRGLLVKLRSADLASALKITLVEVARED
jgi:Cys-tRNA(Pro) deacylase